MFNRVVCAAAVFIIALLARTAAAEPWPIYFATPEETAAAQDLAKYFTVITAEAHKAEAAPLGEKLPDRAIVVGQLGIEVPADLGADGFVIRSNGQRITIAGGGA